MLRSNAWNSPPPEAAQIIELGRQIKKLKTRILITHHENVFEANPIEQIEYVEQRLSGLKGYFAFLDKRYRVIKKQWAQLRREDYQCSMLEQAEELRLVSNYLGLLEGLRSQNILASELFGQLWKAEESNWEELDRYIEWVVGFRKLFVERGLTERAIKTASESKPNLDFIQQLANLAESIGLRLDEIITDVEWPSEYFSGKSIFDICNRLEELVRGVDRCHSWATYENVHKKIRSSFAQEVLGWLSSRQVDRGQLPKALERAFYQKWLTDVLEARPSLREFHSLTHEQRLREFRELDEKVLLQNQRTIVGRLRSRLQQTLRKEPYAQQMLDLRTQLRRQRNILPLRILMKRCFAVINAIKPCFLMSPQTVAQLVDLEFSKFDLVIFDEASQLPTEDAIGAVIRGRQLVVVGDPKQLPPTNFFAVTNGQVNIERDEDGEPVFQESESILEEVQNSGVPSSRLKWHYRSAHESLITYSNARFYDSDLLTFPSNETDPYQSGLKFVFVEDGLYEGKGLNAAEARRVAGAVVEHFRTNPDDSLGVGTFNLRQQLAIMDELEVRRRNDPSLEKFFDRNVPEPFFVKNLENIQGDERDTIFLSVTYAKAHDGRLRYNFGPLNSENGWRRMNVLTTRARRSMRVFSSIKSEDINPKDTSSKGAELLRGFLRYAEHRRLDSEQISTAAETESPFEYEVFQELTRRGLRLQPQVGVSGYKIDFGVYDDEVTSRFICGIECDGVAYHSSETARDRDRLRQQVLENRGWQIHRIWSTDWFKDREGQIVHLLNSIERLRLEARTPIETNSREKVDKPPISSELTPASAGNSSQSAEFELPNVKPYRFAVLDTNSFYGFHETPDTEILRMIEHVCLVEGPLHREDLCLRIANAFGNKVGSRIATRIQNLAKALEGRGKIYMRGDFAYYPAAPIRVRQRVGTGIPVDRVAPEEIRDATVRVLSNGHHFERLVLINHVRSSFGFERSGPLVRNSIDAVLNNMLAAGIIGEGRLGIGLRSSGPE